MVKPYKIWEYIKRNRSEKVILSSLSPDRERHWGKTTATEAKPLPTHQGNLWTPGFTDSIRCTTAAWVPERPALTTGPQV